MCLPSLWTATGGTVCRYLQRNKHKQTNWNPLLNGKQAQNVKLALSGSGAWTEPVLSGENITLMRDLHVPVFSELSQTFENTDIFKFTKRNLKWFWVKPRFFLQCKNSFSCTLLKW